MPRPKIERMVDSDRLSEAELEDLAGLQHCAAYYGGNMTQSSIARLNLLSVMAQRDQLYDALTSRLAASPTYSTIQLSASAPGGTHRIHLAGPSMYGGTGAILCGLDRHARDPEMNKPLYGFSVGGGHSDEQAYPCPECLDKARPRIAGSMFAHLFRSAL